MPAQICLLGCEMHAIWSTQNTLQKPVILRREVQYIISVKQIRGCFQNNK